MKQKIINTWLPIAILFPLIISCSKQDTPTFSSFKVKINGIAYKPKVCLGFVMNPADTNKNLYIEAYDSNKAKEIDFTIHSYKGVTGNYLCPTPPIYPYNPYQTDFQIYYSPFAGDYMSARHGQMNLLEADNNHVKGTFSFTLDDSTKFTEGEFYLIMKR